MGFMSPVITEKTEWWMVDGHSGTWWFEAEHFSEEEARENYEGDEDSIWEVELIEGYGARLSANGYMDCTEWCVYETSVEAAEDLLEMYYYDQDPEYMEEDEKNEMEELEEFIRTGGYDN